MTGPYVKGFFRRKPDAVIAHPHHELIVTVVEDHFDFRGPCVFSNIHYCLPRVSVEQSSRSPNRPARHAIGELEGQTILIPRLLEVGLQRQGEAVPVELDRLELKQETAKAIARIYQRVPNPSYGFREIVIAAVTGSHLELQDRCRHRLDRVVVQTPGDPLPLFLVRLDAADRAASCRSPFADSSSPTFSTSLSFSSRSCSSVELLAGDRSRGESGESRAPRRRCSRSSRDRTASG